ncbi:hypothetical protein DICVIV_01550 [Dictyocaulus viviparus]|uniref:Uncharacterized protein n=1 Tax=Dictyocaulus viviparus TaxID=29172 RepID=A0A0D8Y7R8_DICVI|nr:hypothetical protein DICVIV_01550 [Dictyocaulus viviparus]
MYVQGGVAVASPAVVLTRSGSTIGGEPDRSNSLPLPPHQQSSISTQGTTYTAPSSSRHHDEAALPQNLFDELPAEEQSPPSPPKQRGVDKDGSFTPVQPEPPHLSDHTGRPPSQEAPQDPQCSSTSAGSTESQIVVPTDPTQGMDKSEMVRKSAIKDGEESDSATDKKPSDIHENTREQVKILVFRTVYSSYQPYNTIYSCLFSNISILQISSLPTDPPITNKSVSSNQNETQKRSERLELQGNQSHDISAHVQSMSCAQRERSESSLINNTLNVFQNARSSTDEELWFDVGIIKGTSCLVTHYFLHGDQSLESTYGVGLLV